MVCCPEGRLWLAGKGDGNLNLSKLVKLDLLKLKSENEFTSKVSSLKEVILRS